MTEGRKLAGKARPAHSPLVGGCVLLIVGGMIPFGGPGSGKGGGVVEL